MTTQPGVLGTEVWCRVVGGGGEGGHWRLHVAGSRQHDQLSRYTGGGSSSKGIRRSRSSGEWEEEVAPGSHTFMMPARIRAHTPCSLHAADDVYRVPYYNDNPPIYHTPNTHPHKVVMSHRGPPGVCVYNIKQ